MRLTRNKLKFQLQKEEKILDEKWEKEKQKQNEERMLKKIQALSQETEFQMQLAERRLAKTSKAKKMKEQVKRQKLKEIERDIKRDKMERMQRMFDKLDRQVEVVKQLKANELSVRMHLKKKLI